ncbi:RPS27 [Branchiostoma lanceolatum]|uniref:RPS27 protein n=1 Tax=Branchiostoma lanceolatum TaxID=7740 RepID=A0A8J9ZBI2_BRALA|nr:RPS27 [Branchiostoma lanceolatum]
MPLAKDLLHPSPEEEKRKHKKKRLVQSPNSYFMDVKCPEPPGPATVAYGSSALVCKRREAGSPSTSSESCYKITTVFSHAQTVVLCVGCSTVLCQPTGGRARLTEAPHTSQHAMGCMKRLLVQTEAALELKLEAETAGHHPVHGSRHDS